MSLVEMRSIALARDSAAETASDALSAVAPWLAPRVADARLLVSRLVSSASANGSADLRLTISADDRTIRFVIADDIKPARGPWRHPSVGVQPRYA